jgi:hypothetical protein
MTNLGPVHSACWRCRQMRAMASGAQWGGSSKLVSDQRDAQGKASGAGSIVGECLVQVRCFMRR